MKNHKTNTLKTLVSLETKECDSAAQKLANANNQVKESEISLKMLVDYHHEYLKSFAENSKTGTDREKINNFHRFIKKLEQAISGQEATLNEHRDQALQALKEWQLHERKKLSYGVILKNDQQKAAKIALRKEQQIMDESASRTSRAQLLKAHSR